MAVALPLGLLIALVSPPGLSPVAPAGPASADLPRAEQLYENHCTACHESTLHVSRDRRASSPDEVRARVRHWSNYEGLGWSEEEVDDVSNFLVRRYYRDGPARPGP